MARWYGVQGELKLEQYILPIVMHFACQCGAPSEDPWGNGIYNEFLFYECLVIRWFHGMQDLRR